MKWVKSKIVIPASAIEELDTVEKADWSQGVSLDHLLDWINLVVAMYYPDDGDARASPEFSTRSFRHYQTLGCIDPPAREGKRVTYSFRHYLQGLLVRKFLWEGSSSDQIIELLKGRTNSEYKRLLFQGVELVPAQPDTEFSKWMSADIGMGVELRIREGSEGKANEVPQVLERIESLLRQHWVK